MSPVSAGPELTQEVMGARTEEDSGLRETTCVSGMLVLVVRGRRLRLLRLLHPLAPSSSPSCLPLAFATEMCSLTASCGEHRRQEYPVGSIHGVS